MYWEPDKFQESIAPYYELITNVDEAVKMIREELKRDGVANNTIIILTSDNGYFTGSHGLGDKVLQYEEGARVPLIIYDPRQPEDKRHKTCDALVANIDFAPTILNFGGVKTPEKMDGVSLVPLLTNTNSKVRNSLLLVQNWAEARYDYSLGLAVVTPTWKYLYWCYGDQNIKPSEELYHLKSDPFELKNVIDSADDKKALQKLKEYYNQYLRKIKTQSVKIPKYQRLGILFDPAIPWEDKSFYRPIGEYKKDIEDRYRKITGHNPPKISAKVQSVILK